MTRRALLIGAPGKEAKGNYLQGVSVDMQNMASFLNSDIGGAWSINEITYLRNPGKIDLLRELRSLVSYNYSIVYFSGHGGISTRDRLQYIEINDQGEDICINDLTDKSEKELLILDTCSSYFTPKQLLAESMMKATLRLDEYSSREKHRYFYDELLLQSEPGTIIINSASPGEAAGEDVNGGYFTQGLIGSGVTIKRETRNRVFHPINDAFSEARFFVSTRSKSQNPLMTGSVRRNHWFPFSVKA